MFYPRTKNVTGEYEMGANIHVGIVAVLHVHT